MPEMPAPDRDALKNQKMLTIDRVTSELGLQLLQLLVKLVNDVYAIPIVFSSFPSPVLELLIASPSHGCVVRNAINHSYRFRSWYTVDTADSRESGTAKTAATREFAVEIHTVVVTLICKLVRARSSLAGFIHIKDRIVLESTELDSTAHHGTSDAFPQSVGSSSRSRLDRRL